MKVAITHTRYTFKGGVERYVFDLVRRLADAGHDVHFFAHFWDEHVDPRVTLHKIPNRWKQIRFMKVWSFDRWLSAKVKRSEWDVVHGFSKSSFQDLYTDGSGCLLDYQAYSVDHAGGGALKRAFKRRSAHQKTVLEIEKRRFTRGNFHKVITMSELVANQIRGRYDLTAEEVYTIYNGIDTERFQPSNAERFREALRAEHGIPSDAFVVLCVANDYVRKGIPALIETARLVRERGGLPGGRKLHIAVVGKESKKRVAALTRCKQEKGVDGDVVFYGPQDAIDQWHAAADVFALPTLFDAFGNVVLEALASGVPSLVSAKAGAAEVVDHGRTGYVFQNPEDAPFLADKLIELAGDDAKLAAWGRAARTAAEGYSWDRHFDAMLALYDEVAELKRGQP